MLKKIRKYEKRLDTLSLNRLIIEVSLIAFVVKFMAAIFLVPLTPYLPELTMQPSMDEYLAPSFIVLVIILAPFIETILFQYFIIETSMILTGKKWIAILLSVVVFSALHGFPDLLIILPLAYIFAFIYYMQRQVSRWRAIWVVSVLHMIHNALAWGIGMLGLLSLS